MTASALPHDPHLTGIAIAHKNPDAVLIADSVLPRVPVTDVLFKWTKYGDMADAFTLPDTKVGPRGRMNRVELKGERLTDECEDNGLEVPLSHYDVRPGGNTQPTGVRIPRAQERATNFATNLVKLVREVRVAQMVFNAATYPEDKREQLADTEQFNNANYDGDAVELISEGLEVPLVRPNVLIFGSLAWSVFRSLPEVNKSINRNSGDKGRVSREAVAELFEVQEVLVGQAWHNTAKKGEATNMQRAWHKDIAAIYRDRSAETEGVTFGITAQYGDWIAMSNADKDVGLRGGEVVRVGETIKEKIVAPDVGYFWEDVVAVAA